MHMRDLRIIAVNGEIDPRFLFPFIGSADVAGVNVKLCWTGQQKIMKNDKNTHNSIE